MENTKRYQTAVIMAATIRQDIKYFKLTGVVPDYAVDLGDMQRLASHYAESAARIRNK